MTIQQAADFLNVSAEYVLRLVLEGQLPSSLYLQDVAAFKQARDKDRREALKELVRLTEEFGGYDDDAG